MCLTCHNSLSPHITNYSYCFQMPWTILTMWVKECVSNSILTIPTWISNHDLKYFLFKGAKELSRYFKGKYKKTTVTEWPNYWHFPPRFVTRGPVRGGDRSLSPRIRPLSARLKVRPCWPQLQVSDGFGAGPRLRGQRSHQQVKRSKVWHFSGTRRKRSIPLTSPGSSWY